MADVLPDTDVFIDHLRGAQRLHEGSDTIHYSVVTRAELFAGRGAEESRVALLLAPFPELPVDRAVAERAGRLRRGSAIRLPDALIAATAIEHGCVLVTRNVRDFKDIPHLRVRQPRAQAR
ncbi:type II toxin-antitoxin system VapC family toxin [soil metagenome]